MNEHIEHPAIKAVSAVIAASVATVTWSQVAAILASLYTAILIGEWAWKRMIKPLAIRRGWIKPKTIYHWEDQ